MVRVITFDEYNVCSHNSLWRNKQEKFIQIGPRHTDTHQLIFIKKNEQIYYSEWPTGIIEEYGH